jgi:hypothetical protein
MKNAAFHRDVKLGKRITVNGKRTEGAALAIFSVSFIMKDRARIIFA